jgi:hypothetical protein
MRAVSFPRALDGIVAQSPDRLSGGFLFHAGLKHTQGGHSVLYGDSLVTRDAAAERSSGTNRLLRRLHALC